MKLRDVLAVAWTSVVLASAATAQATDATDNLALGKAREFMAAGKLEQALKAFKDANKERDGSCAVCYLGMAMAYAKMGDPKATLESSEKALKYATDDDDRALAHNMCGHAFIALAMEQPRKLLEAEHEFRQAVQFQPDNANFHVNLGVALAKLMHDDEAVKEFKTSVSLASDDEVRNLAASFAANPRRAREPFAPDFEVSTSTGETISLSKFAGKIVVLDFWATWCPPCRASVPDMKELIKKYGSDQLVVISISWDQDEQAWRDYIAKHNMNWLHARDPQSKISQKFGVRAVPTYLVIDGDSFIKERIVGTNPQQSLAYRLREKLQSMPQLAKK